MIIATNTNLSLLYSAQSLTRLDPPDNAYNNSTLPHKDDELERTSLVNISAKAESLLKQEQSADKKQFTKAEFQAVFQRTNGPNSNSVRLGTQINSQGRASPLLMQQPLDSSPERLAQAEKVASFVFLAHTTLKETGNPYGELSRDELSDILYDETGNHTPAERYLASLTRQKNDFDFTTRNTTGLGTSYQAQIAFYDAQSEVERSVYPEGHRAQLVSFLEQAEANGYPNTEEAIWDPWMTKYFRKPNPNTPIAEHSLIQVLPAKTTETAPLTAEKSA